MTNTPSIKISSSKFEFPREKGCFDLYFTFFFPQISLTSCMTNTIGKFKSFKADIPYDTTLLYQHSSASLKYLGAPIISHFGP